MWTCGSLIEIYWKLNKSIYTPTTYAKLRLYVARGKPYTTLSKMTWYIQIFLFIDLFIILFLFCRPYFRWNYAIIFKTKVTLCRPTVLFYLKYGKYLEVNFFITFKRVENVSNLISLLIQYIISPLPVFHLTQGQETMTRRRRKQKIKAKGLRWHLALQKRHQK